jgi:hypothetical protein
MVVAKRLLLALQQWQELTQSPLLYSPSIGMSPQLSVEKLGLTAETFACWL